MANWQGLAAWGKREQRAGDRLPYARHLDDHTIELRDGSLMQCLHLEGFAFETADTDELNHRQTLRDVSLRAVASSRLVIHHHVVRRRVEVSVDGDFADPVCADLNARWGARLASRQLFVNDLFLTIVRRPPAGKVGWAERAGRLFAKGSAAGRAAQAARELRELDAARTSLAAALAPYGPRLLGRYDSGNGTCSEPLELISTLFNGELRPVLEPTGDAGHYIPYKRLSFGAEAIEAKGPAGKSFAGILSIKEYPPHTLPGMTDALLRLPHEMVLSESFAFVDRQIALERVSLALRRFKSADDDGVTLRRGLTEAKDAIASGGAAFGEHHLTVLVREASLDALDRAVADSAAALADIGAIAVREDIALEPAFWAQFPGNLDYAARKALISTGNFAGLASFHGFAIGQAEGNHWGPAITVFESTSGTPYFFNFHKGDLGNFTVIGPSGSGKTVVLNFLAAQAQKLKPRTVVFDKDRGAEIFVRAIGGRYASLRAGVATGFNPLQLPDSPGNRAFLRTWMARLVAPASGPLTADEEATIAAAVDANFDQDLPFRRLRYFQELLAGMRRPTEGDLAARLAPWCGRGDKAWLFDNATDGLDLSAPTLGFDMTELLDDPALRTPTMMYLFQRIEERLDGAPTMIVIDEGWKALDDEIFAARLRDWMKTLRKRNAIVGFGTQSARDALDSRIAATIVEQTATQIFMPNPRATAEDYGDGFGLTAHELDLIRALPAQSHAFLVKHGNHSVVARLDLSSMPDLLTMLSGREASVRRLDELRASLGDAPAAWWPALIGTRYPGATADLLPFAPREAAE